MHPGHARPAAGRSPHAGDARRRALLAGALLTAALILPGAVQTAAAAADTSIGVIRDSVIVANPAAGATTVKVTRPDAVTGAPIVIGQFSGTAGGTLPLTVNTTPAGPMGPADCWQSGALPSAITPDIRPGDLVTVRTTPDPSVGGAPVVTSLTVPDGDSSGASGPIPDCQSIAPFAQNAITSAPKQIGADPLALSGVAQPMATGVSASATDGRHTTAPVSATPAADGTWSATIPAAQLAPLANDKLTITPVFTVPDVATGAPAHIAGGPVSVTKAAAAAAPAAASGGAARHGAGARALSVSAMRVPASVSLAAARRRGIAVSFVAPASAKVVRVQLKRGRRTLLERTVESGKAGRRQTVRLRSDRLRRTLRRGRYAVVVTAGASRRDLGTPASSAVRVR